MKKGYIFFFSFSKSRFVVLKLLHHQTGEKRKKIMGRPLDARCSLPSDRPCFEWK